MAGFKLPPMMFTDDEALALSVGLLAARGLGLSEPRPAVESAQAKLERVMPAHLKRRVRAVDETMPLDLRDAPSPADNAALVVLSSAALASSRCTCNTARRTAAAPASASFDPYGLAFRGGCWYALGWCHLRGAMRSFRLDRIATVREAPRFMRPPGFDALAIWRSFATMPRRQRRGAAAHRPAHRPARGLRHLRGARGDGRRGSAARPVRRPRRFARELARLPFRFEIRRPKALRTALRACARDLLALAEA